MKEKSVHYALAEPSRVRILDALRERGPLDARELAEAAELHANTVRAHLDVLREAGLVRSDVERSARRGRPRLLFEAAGSGGDPEHELLATALAGSLAQVPNGAERAEAAGRGWGRYPGVVCALHLGLLRGAAEGSEIDVERLEPFAGPGLCVATLRRRQAVPDSIASRSRSE